MIGDKKRANEPMDRITMPSALLARRLRSSLWCQKQVVIGHRGRSAKNMNPFLLALFALIVCIAMTFADEKKPMLANLELFKQEAMQIIISETKDLSEDRLTFHNALYSIDPVPSGATIVCHAGICRPVKCDFAESVTIWFKDKKSEKTIMSNGKQNQQVTGYAAIFMIIGDTKSVTISSAPITMPVEQ